MDYNIITYKRTSYGTLQCFTIVPIKATKEDKALDEFDIFYEKMFDTKEFFELYCENTEKVIATKYGY